jgi:hypothetical protein
MTNVTDRPQPPRDSAVQGALKGVNPGYAAFQIAKALTTREEHEDPAARARAAERVSRWETVLRNVFAGSVDYGSRTPVGSAPGWATLEVVTGGFATGALLAGGPLQEHEKELLAGLAGVPAGEERRALNACFLTDAGLARLQDWLRTGCYDVAVPEEGALLVAAWLVEHGYAEDARGLLEEISPFFLALRFYPIPLARPRRYGPRVHVQDVGETIADLRKIRLNDRVLAQKEAIEVWTPLHDRAVALFLETVEDGWPCQRYPDGWPARALALLGEHAELSREHALRGKPARANGHSSQLREFLGRCAREPEKLTGREVGRIRLILDRYLEKRGAPGSPAYVEARRHQAAEVSAPLHGALAAVVIPRLAAYAQEGSVEDVGPLQAAVSPEEAASTGIPEGTPVPASIRRKVERCLSDTVEVLVERGLITSGETLARVLPQMTSGIRAAGIGDPSLRALYAAIYRAFRRRRSLLLLNLEKQIRIEGLPWIAAIERFRSESLSGREVARQTLEEVALLTLRSFPYVIFPNKLLQELRTLVKGAGLDLPIVDELAADIFMGSFTKNFVEASRRAADLLEGSLYATYFAIDFAEVRRISDPDPFVRLCADRAGVALGTWDPATNGMILEQQQILTTQNLAALFAGLDLADALRGQLGEMARQCFTWICRRQQMKIDQWHARLIMVKKTAYAWRQMVFFLALLPADEVAEFLRWAEGHLEAQPGELRNRFRPALTGLGLAAEGVPIESPAAQGVDARRFLGWSKTRHWLLADDPGQHPITSG